MRRRYGQIMVGLFLLFIGLNAISDGNMFGVMMGLGGFYMLARQFEESRYNRQRERYQDWESRERAERARYDFSGVRNDVDRRPQANAERVYSHALEAVQLAGLDPSEMAVLPVDLGILGHRADSKPQLYRTRNIPKDVDYIQPFVQLRVPRRANGKITFELIDDLGQTVFVREETHELQRGRNLIVPSRRLPVHDALDMDEGGWSLRIHADGILLAEHDFSWAEPIENIVVDRLSDDGEISQELQAAMSASEMNPMSLDELLGYDDGDDDQQRRAR